MCYFPGQEAGGPLLGAWVGCISLIGFCPCAVVLVAVFEQNLSDPGPSCFPMGLGVVCDFSPTVPHHPSAVILGIKFQHTYFR